MSLQRPALQSITPMIPTIGSLADALKFFKDEMGFSVLWEGSGMAVIGRDSISFNLIEVENDNRNRANNASFSIGVSNLDALFEEYRDISAQVGPLDEKSPSARNPLSQQSVGRCRLRRKSPACPILDQVTIGIGRELSLRSVPAWTLVRSTSQNDVEIRMIKLRESV